MHTGGAKLHVLPRLPCRGQTGGSVAANLRRAALPTLGQELDGAGFEPATLQLLDNPLDRLSHSHVSTFICVHLFFLYIDLKQNVEAA